MLNLDLTKVENKEYVNFPVGKTKCWVNNIFKKTPQGGGTSFLEVKLTDGNATLTDKLYLTDKAMWRIQQFLKACQLPHKGNVQVEESDIRNRHIIVECVAEAYRKQDGTEGTAIKVKNYLVDPEFGYGPIQKQEPVQEVAEDDIPY